MPIGMPGCPELAACTASIANARMAYASRLVSTVAAATASGEAARFGVVEGAVMVLEAKKTRGNGSAPGTCGRQPCCRTLKLSPKLRFSAIMLSYIGLQYLHRGAGGEQQWTASIC